MLFWASVAAAGMVGGVLPGTETVGLLLCAPDSPCVEEARWLEEHVAEAKALPVMFFAEAVSDPGDTVATTLENGKRFADAIASARSEWTAGHTDLLSARLDDAEKALATVEGPVSQQSLFDLYFFRGAVKVMNGDTSAAASLARAAAVAWNRTVELPQTEGPVATAYRDAQHRIMHAHPGKIVLDTGLGVWSLDGVEIGVSGSATVLPGTHRVVSQIPGRGRAWVKTVEVQSGSTVELAASFPAEMAADTLADAVRAAASGGTLDSTAAAVLKAWRDQRDITEIRVFYVAGAPLADRELSIR